MSLCRTWRHDVCTEPGRCDCWCHKANGSACTCTELQRMTVCHDIRNEPHLVGCPRWGTPLLTPISFGFIKDPADARPGGAMSHTRTTKETTTTEYNDEGRIVRQVVVTVETVTEDEP